MKHDCRLYLVTPPAIADLNAFCDDFARALDAGDVACIQLRLKSPEGVAAGDDEVLRAAEALLPIARDHDAAFLINDRPDLALKSGADGVHVGQSDASCKKARVLLGDDATVGVTCHNSKHLALEAGEAGADYVAFGAFFPTKTKEAPTQADPALLEWWSYATTLPCVAIGGITPENCAPLVRAGADFLAVSGAVWSHPEGPAAAVKAFAKAIADA
ncbi:thiamine phosphate synthase [Hyphococcus sp.]|jgi:thiamine-phosphate pyrophosphorylase|uniref:thiamine phosphate synthase n=1 Tax=Hyphococcus sp. TaxID=2038636 RepID=UPI003D0D6F6F